MLFLARARIMAGTMIDSIEREIPRLRRFARCLVRDADLADDMVQQCLLRALDKSHPWPSGAHLRTSLLAILHHCHVAAAQHAAPLPVVHHAEPGGASDGRAVPVTRAAIRDAFMRLGEEDREILLLVVVEELDHGQAADILDIPVATVGARLARAREALRGASGLRPIPPLAQSAG
jgi:RNA polymerase sigma-70 factor, ECF subfamily